MTVTLSPCINPEDGRAEFTVSRFGDFFAGEAVEFGYSAGDGANWTGKIPKTADYYIYIVAHPVADYRLEASVE